MLFDDDEPEETPKKVEVKEKPKEKNSWDELSEKWARETEEREQKFQEQQEETQKIFDDQQEQNIRDQEERIEKLRLWNNQLEEREDLGERKNLKRMELTFD